MKTQVMLEREQTYRAGRDQPKEGFCSLDSISSRPSCHSPESPPCGGFTLIELVLALGILLVVFTASFPLLDRSLAHWSTERFASEALTAVRMARFHAITRSRDVQIRFNASQETIAFYVCPKQADDGCESGEWKRLDRIPLLHGDPAWVELWAIGDGSSQGGPNGSSPLTSGVACLVYSPSGFFFQLTLDQTEDTLDCSGTSIGYSVIFTTNPPPTADGDKTRPKDIACDYLTLHFLSGASGRAFLIPYGAYLGDTGRYFGEYTMGDPPECARAT